jgi:hypothetical protein
MTLDELDHQLPNGFHDAELHDLKIDYVHRTMTLRLAIDFGNPDGPKREDYRLGELLVTDLFFCSIDPPDPNHGNMPGGSPLSVSGDKATADTLHNMEAIIRNIPSGASCYSFFVYDWNSFITIAARDVQLRWIE